MNRITDTVPALTGGEHRTGGLRRPDAGDRGRPPRRSPGPAWSLALVAVLLLGAQEATAHHHHHEGAAMPADSAMHHPHEADSMSSDSAVALQAGGAAPADSGRARPPAARYVMAPLGRALLEHPHNKLVHFPIALSMAGLLFLIRSRRRGSGLADAARWLIALSALGAVAAFVTGLLQAASFRGDAREWVVLVHRSWGTAGAVALVVWALLAAWRSSRRYALAWGFLAVGIVLVAAFYGGVVAYGD
jgi:uncharacterized membrane protein